MSADSEIETKIVDFLRQNGKSAVLIIFQELGLNRSTVCRILYNLEESNQVFKCSETPPVWDLTENKKKNEIKHTLKGGLKACHIAQSLGQPTKNIKKQLYILEKEGKVQKFMDTSLWTLNDEESNDSYNQESSCSSSSSSDHILGSNSGLSQSFDVITELGKGGFGFVYKVKHKYDDKIYALKKVVLTEKADSEVKALARLDHPNIVRYITCWPDSESCTSNQVSNSKMYLFIQMEFCEGGTLTTWINDRNIMNKQRTTVEIHKIFYEIISGVEYIHSNNLIHRDLKPDNILFGTDGKVKIGDFGLVVHQTTDSGDPIERSKRRGTPPYMSPEQENKRNYDEKTDIFPLGLIWFEMLWKVSTGMERVKLWPDLRNQRFPEGFCDSYPTENKFIKEMLSFTPEDRPQAKHIREKLEMFFSLDQNLLSQNTI